ncbi:type II restriction endonuclease [Empedobacter brevis]|uniref:type II restriction endonuclease n=1 Tax=Empedobacter brevis TaxID=247 RepID=UPI00289FDD56|nr:type II restriction endonuclease [Empedobacter brevis]
MKNLSTYCEVSSDDDLFEYIRSTFKNKITQWDYFVNWLKVFANIEPIEKELNLLNVLIGKENFEEEAYKLIQEYPNVIKAFPTLIAIRETSIDILIDVKEFVYQHFDFRKSKLTHEEILALVDFMVQSGLKEVIQNKKVKNLVDYATGVEVGLDSNGRKNRGGALMEKITEEFVKQTCEELNLPYLAQASASKIKANWGIDIVVDKSSRILDFVINKNGKLYFIECNFYGGGGSKLKSTATEYIEMNRYWKDQNIEFIWVTDGAGWHTTLRPLREFFDKGDYLLNLEMLKSGMLKQILS